MKKIDALLALRSDGRFLIGRDRILLLEAVAEHSSISKAAKLTGFSYKTAWDAVDAVNNLLPTPAFITKAGGKGGAGAVVTPEGLRLIATFRKLEERLTHISSLIARDGLEDDDDDLLWAMGLKISARNVFRCTVTALEPSAVDVMVTMQLSQTQSLQASITNAAVAELGLEIGVKVLALVKAPFVKVQAASAAIGPNQLPGAIVERRDDIAKSELRLTIAPGKTLVAVMSRAAADAEGLHENSTALASFDPTHVILAVP